MKKPSFRSPSPKIPAKYLILFFAFLTSTSAFAKPVLSQIPVNTRCIVSGADTWQFTYDSQTSYPQLDYIRHTYSVGNDYPIKVMLNSGKTQLVVLKSTAVKIKERYLNSAVLLSSNSSEEHPMWEDMREKTAVEINNAISVVGACK